MKKIEPGGVSDRVAGPITWWFNLAMSLKSSILAFLLSSFLTPGHLFLQSVYQIVVWIALGEKQCYFSVRDTTIVFGNILN